MKIQFLATLVLPGNTNPCIFIEGLMCSPTLPGKGEKILVPDKEEMSQFFKNGLPSYSTDFTSYDVIEVDHLLEKAGVIRPRINFEVNVNHSWDLESDWERLSLLSTVNLKVYMSEGLLDEYKITDKIEGVGYQDRDANELIQNLATRIDQKKGPL